MNPDLDPSLKAAAIMFRDLQGRRPIALIYSKPQTCPHCGDNLYLATMRTGWFPYLHTDFTLACETCLKKYLFGVALTKDAGLSLITWDTNPVEAIKKMVEQRLPICPFHKTSMAPTKIFGDSTNPEQNEVTLQWKCTICFLTHHITVERTYPHGDIDPFTDKEKTIIRKRLEALGYLE